MNASRKELLISRLASGEADDREFYELAAMAEQEPSLWREVVETRRDQARLEAMMDDVTELADAVDADAAEGGGGPIVRTRPVGVWSGWAVAAMILLAWSLVALRGGMPGPSTVPKGVQTAGANLPDLSTQEAFNRYLTQGREEGRVLSEEPRRVILYTRPNPAGDGVEIIYHLQIMERTTVPNLYRFSGQDERGEPSFERYRAPVRGRM